MATMIPSRYDESTRSAAEKRLFDRLARDPDTEGWVVLHSLGLSERQGRPYGEIDFVVLVPGERDPVPGGKGRPGPVRGRSVDRPGPNGSHAHDAAGAPSSRRAKECSRSERR